MAKEKPEIEWAVYFLREKAKYIGRVYALDAQSAIKTAIKGLKIPERLRSKLKPISLWRGPSYLKGDGQWRLKFSQIRRRMKMQELELVFLPTDGGARRDFTILWDPSLGCENVYLNHPAKPDAVKSDVAMYGNYEFLQEKLGKRIITVADSKLADQCLREIGRQLHPDGKPDPRFNPDGTLFQSPMIADFPGWSWDLY
jgi:hypothetical protein